jgi:hypothetical protein
MEVLCEGGKDLFMIWMMNALSSENWENEKLTVISTEVNRQLTENAAERSIHDSEIV